MRLNLDSGMCPGASLPPYTGRFRSINGERMKKVYEIIASSISDLTRQQFVRGLNVINNDIIVPIQSRRECEQAYGKSELMQAYDQKFTDL